MNTEQELKKLKEAIVDLYLAIKIRSTEEVRVCISNSQANYLLMNIRL